MLKATIRGFVSNQEWGKPTISQVRTTEGKELTIGKFSIRPKDYSFGEHEPYFSENIRCSMLLPKGKSRFDGLTAGSFVELTGWVKVNPKVDSKNRVYANLSVQVTELKVLDAPAEVQIKHVLEWAREADLISEGSQKGWEEKLLVTAAKAFSEGRVYTSLPEREEDEVVGDPTDPPL